MAEIHVVRRSRTFGFDSNVLTRQRSRRALSAATQSVFEGLETRTLFGLGQNNDSSDPNDCPPNTSSAPINYATGKPTFVSTDLVSNAFGSSFGQSRIWKGVNDAGQVGNGWADQSLDYLVITLNQFAGTSGHGGKVKLIHNGGGSITFDVSATGDQYTAQYNGLETLTYTPPVVPMIIDSPKLPGEFTYTDSAGNVTKFFDLPRDTNGGGLIQPGGTGHPKYGRLYGGQGRPQEATSLWFDTTTGAAGTTTDTYRFGAFKSYTDASGKLQVTASYDANGNLDTVTRTDGTGNFERFDYTFTELKNDANADSVEGGTGDAKAWLISGVELERGTGSGSTPPSTWDAVRSVDYTYYTGFGSDSAYGRFGDLKLVSIKDANSNIIESKYYRYVKQYGRQFYGNGTGSLGTGGASLATSGGSDATFPVKTDSSSTPADFVVTSGLKSVFEGAAYARLAADEGSQSSIDSLTDSVVAPYSQYVFEYGRFDSGDVGYADANGKSTVYRVIQEQAAAQGCSMCSQGFGTFRFEYEDINGNFNSYDGVADANIARMRTVEFLSDTSNTLSSAVSKSLTYNTSTSGRTMTVSWTNHGFNIGDRIHVSGSGSAYADGSFRISAITTNTFSYTMLQGLTSAPTSANIVNIESTWSDNDQNVVFTNEQGKVVLASVKEIAGHGRTITAISGDFFDWTITAANHGFVVGDVVELSGDSYKSNYAAEVTEVLNENQFVVAEWTGVERTPGPGSTPGGGDTSASRTFSLATLVRPTHYRFDGDGRIIWLSHPSALSGYSQAYDDLVGVEVDETTGPEAVFLRDDAGRIDITRYGLSETSSLGDGDATTDTNGDVVGYLKATYVSRGVPEGNDEYSGTNVVQLTGRTYYKMTHGGTSIYPLASETVYFDNAGSSSATTRFTYLRYNDGTSATNRISRMTKILPAVSSTQHGNNSTSSVTAVYDYLGRMTWYRDGDGFLSYIEYDSAGGVKSSLVDANTTRDTDHDGDDSEQSTQTFTGLPSDGSTLWATPSGAGLHLRTARAFDLLGRQTKLTDPKGNVTYTIYRDADHEVRTYRGWNPTTGVATGPTLVTREDWARRYSESLMMTATPATSGSSGSYVPTGAESIGTIQSLTRQINNDAGQIIETDRYYSMPSGGYSATSLRLGSADDDSAEGNYHVVLSDFDGRGWSKRSVSSAGTVTRYLYDARGNLLSEWVGTDDVPTSGYWSPTNTSGTDLTQTFARTYDADGNLVSVTVFPNQSGVPNPVTRNYYDYRDRLVATKLGDEGGSGESTTVQRSLTYYTLDAASRIISIASYDADGLVVSYTDGVPNAPSSGLTALSEMSYDDRSRLYETSQRFVDPTAGLHSTKKLTSGNWYDGRDNIIKQTAPGAPTEKTSYDGAGRVSKTFSVDATSDSSYSDAVTVAGNFVLEQTKYDYDANGNVILITTSQRFHTATQTGELGGPSAGSGVAKSRDSYVAQYFDKIDRMTRSMNVGTYGGASFTVSDVASNASAARSNTKLITTYQYDSAGRLFKTTNARNVQYLNYYDLLGRKIHTIDAATTADSREITYSYNGANNVLSLKAMLPDSPDDADEDTGFQETRYVYGATTSSGSTITSNELLREIRYPSRSHSTDPDSSTNIDMFAASTSEAEKYSYNALGERIGLTDRRGVVHAFDRDVLGRPTADRITSFGSGGSAINQDVDSLISVYDSAGRVFSLTSMDGSTPVNEVQYIYNGFGQVVIEYQDHSTSVNTSASPKTQYSYAEGTDNSSRMTGMTYPNGRALNYDYASGSGSAGIDAHISRLSSIKEGTTVLEAYSYLGLDTHVLIDRPAANSHLTFDSGNDTVVEGAGDRYVGFDLFGRVVRMRWETDDSTPVLLDEIAYSYDRNSNRIKADYNLSDTLSTPTVGGNQMDYVWGYDSLDRLVEIRRGTMDHSATLWKMAAPKELIGYSLDDLGNIIGIMTVTDPAPGVGDANFDGNVDFDDLLIVAQSYGTDHGSWGSGDFNGDGFVDFDDLLIYTQTEDSTPTVTKSIETRTYNGQNQLITMDSGSTTLTYDAAGNQSADQAGNVTEYDGWNRATEVSIGATSLTTYSYDALGRRTIDGGIHNYWNDEWQLLEERATATSPANEQFVWSDVYIDTLILRDRNADNSSVTGSNGLEERVFPQWDANYNVIGTIQLDTDSGTSGSQTGVIERYRYSAYGDRTVLNSDWTGDTLAGSDTTSSDDGAAGWNKSDVLLADGFQGTAADRVIEGNSNVRHRVYSSDQMRWTQKDPYDYIDGANLHQAFLSNPNNNVDPSGLSAFDGWWDGAKALVGAADEEVQDAFDQSAWDRTLGTADAAVEYATDGLIDSVGGFTFDCGNRENAHTWGTGIIEATAAAINMAQAAKGLGRKAGCRSTGKCFVAGTPVLLGDGRTQINIENIKVGQRVATDGGVANSDDEKTRATDVNATEVNPKTWRLVHLTINARTADGQLDVMDVQTLMPLATLLAQHARAGAHIPVPLDLGDINENGEGAIVRAISPCPKIESGPGRVVLSTITHLNDFGFKLTLADKCGKTDTLGVTGFHKLYTEERGWQSTVDLRIGEELRGENGALTVVSLVRDVDVHQVYNLTVEADHVYYVGDLTALSHNASACDRTTDEGRRAYNARQRAERRENRSRGEEGNGQTRTGEGNNQKRRDEQAAKEARERAEGERIREQRERDSNRRERNIGIGEEHSRVHKGSHGQPRGPR